ncbi:MAG: hypothetical protein OHK0029_15150 [Armatimonadaceae bacterium]
MPSRLRRLDNMPPDKNRPTDDSYMHIGVVLQALPDFLNDSREDRHAGAEL